MALGLPLLMIAALTSSGFHDGCACRTSAAVPATWGEAIDVPDNDSCRLPLPEKVEMVGLPGAEISGFRTLSPLRGPPELNEATPEICGVPVVIEMARPSRRTSLAPSDCGKLVKVPLTPKNGIVTS